MYLMDLIFIFKISGNYLNKNILIVIHDILKIKNMPSTNFFKYLNKHDVCCFYLKTTNTWKMSN